MTRHFRRTFVLALIIGLGLFGIVTILTVGEPFQYYPRFCFFSRCAYEPLFVGLDLLFWVGVGFVIVSTAESVSEKWGEEPFLQNDERAKVKFLVAVVFFGSATFSLWAGLWTGAGIFGWYGWYIGALVFAISGSIVLMLPGIRGTNGNGGVR